MNTSKSTANQTAPRPPIWQVLAGLGLVFVLAVLVAELDTGIAAWFKGRGVGKNPLEYPLTAAVVGLLANWILRRTKAHAFVKPGIRTELFLKIGLVLLGARVSLGEIMSKGLGGLLQAVIMVSAVFFFTWWLAGKFKLAATLKAVMATAVSICGVSAAIAAAGAVLAKKEEVTYVTALVIITALPMMVLMPWIAQAIGLSPTVAGAWFGGNIDTTAAVVGAGTMYGPEAQSVAAVVKMAQNVFIGVAAFLLALYFVTTVERKPNEKPSAAVIWQRFPKFVIGFVLLSVLTSLGVFNADALKALDGLSKWAFTFAFIAIGIDLAVGDLRGLGWKPFFVYMAATVFNTLLALGVSSIIFGVLGL
ncbi:MAG TPA: putative sulfate exporter family transporter [Anaerolineae bacterium]|nr:putative sulfate exporter family transporter [Anaerolineae bacterium]HQI86000.1 putative sulfate exporter family transporter [Anaerolineae bacterium]